MKVVRVSARGMSERFYMGTQDEVHRLDLIRIELPVVHRPEWVPELRTAIDPRREDFFRKIIEERKALGRETRLPATERRRLDLFLKVLANSGSYGVYAELNRQEPRVGKQTKVMVHGLRGPFEDWANAFEAPGEYSFPPFAALTTAGARLILDLLERCVTDLGGTYAFCDTDSMAIVATESGRLVAVPGGPNSLPDGTPTIHALSSVEVKNEIVERFAALNPYDRAIVPGSILKVEKENFDERRKTPQQLYAFVISAKRYALFNLATGRPADFPQDV